MRIAALGIGLTATLALGALALFVWSFFAGPGAGRIQHFEVHENESDASVVARLQAAQLIGSPRLFSAYLSVLNAGTELAVGPHVVRDDLSARELVKRLARSPGRGTAHVVIPEGFNHVQLSERLQQLGVCDAEDFRRAVRDRAHASSLGIPAASAEGYLFPATYELLADSTPAAVVTVLVQEAQRRLAKLQTELAAQF